MTSVGSDFNAERTWGTPSEGVTGRAGCTAVLPLIRSTGTFFPGGEKGRFWGRLQFSLGLFLTALRSVPTLAHAR